MLPLLVSCTGRASARGPRRPAAHGPGRAWIIFCGPGRVRAWNLKARAGPGPVNINFAGRGPGLGLSFPGLGRARAYSESHYYFNIMVKDYLHLSIAKDHCFLCCKYVIALCNASPWLQDRPASQSTIHSILDRCPQLLNCRRAHSKEASRLIV